MAKVVAKTQRKKIVVDSEVLAKDVGEYELLPTFVTTITVVRLAKATLVCDFLLSVLVIAPRFS